MVAESCWSLTGRLAKKRIEPWGRTPFLAGMGLTNVAVEMTHGEILSLPFLYDWYPGLLLGILCLSSARGTFVNVLEEK